jgi:hypothetical protein
MAAGVLGVLRPPLLIRTIMEDNPKLKEILQKLGINRHVFEQMGEEQFRRFAYHLTDAECLWFVQERVSK